MLVQSTQDFSFWWSKTSFVKRFLLFPFKQAYELIRLKLYGLMSSMKNVPKIILPWRLHGEVLTHEDEQYDTSTWVFVDRLADSRRLRTLFQWRLLARLPESTNLVRKTLTAYYLGTLCALIRYFGMMFRTWRNSYFPFRVIKRCLWIRKLYIIDARTNRKIECDIENLVWLFFVLESVIQKRDLVCMIPAVHKVLRHLSAEDVRTDCVSFCLLPHTHSGGTFYKSDRGTVSRDSLVFCTRTSWLSSDLINTLRLAEQWVFLGDGTGSITRIQKSL